MLKEFLEEIGRVTGRTYTTAEFGKMVKEAEAAAQKESSKKKKSSDQKEETNENQNK